MQLIANEKLPSSSRPTRRSVFAVWYWSRRARIALVLLAIIGYPLTAIPVQYLMTSAGINSRTTIAYFRAAYFPVIYCERNIPLVRKFLEWQWGLTIAIFGDPDK